MNNDPFSDLLGAPTSPVDLNALSDASGGDRELEIEIFQAALQNISEHLANLRTLLAAGDSAALAESAHQLKGVTATVGFRKMPDLAKQLQLKAEAQELGEAEALIGQLEASFAEVQVLLKQAIERSQSMGS